MGSKVEEAKEHIKAAEKSLKTSFLKWKPDWDSAADEYNQAAQCYRIARDLRNSKGCYLKAAELFEKNSAFFHAAKALENAILVTKEVSTPEDLFKLAEQSCRLYQLHGSGDSGAGLLDKTGKIIEERSPELALKLFQHAAEVSSTESGQHQAAEYISKASRILVKLRMYDEAVDSLVKEIGFNQEHGNTGNVGRLTVALVLVHLARGDTIAADKVYKEWGSNCEVSERQTIEELLVALDEEDAPGARRALACPFIKHMDVEYARLALSIPLPESIQVPTQIRTNATVTITTTDTSEGGVDDTGYDASRSSLNTSATADDDDQLC